MIGKQERDKRQTEKRKLMTTRIQTLAVKPRYSQWIRSERLPRIMKLKILLDHFMACKDQL